MKFYGKIGFGETVEKSDGIWVEKSDGIWVDTIVEKDYYGDILKNVKRSEDAAKVNDDISISNQLSIVSDPYLTNHFHAIKYVTMFGTNWKVTSVEVQFPRLLLTLGGVYNGQTA